MKPFVSAAALAALVCCWLLPGGPASASVNSLQQQSSDAAARVDRLTGQLNQDRAGFDHASNQADAAAAGESELSTRIETGAAHAAGLRRRLSSEAADLDRARRRYRRAEHLLSARLISIYMAGAPDTTDLVLGSDDFSDLATQSEYLVSIREADQNLAGRVRQVRQTLVASVERIGRLKDQAETQVAALDAARGRIASVRAAAEASAARFASLSASRTQQVDQLKSDIDGWQKQIEKQQQVSAAAAEDQVAVDLGGPYSIPTYIVMCESGGNYAALNASSGAGGAYQILPSTWTAYGGSGLPNEASKAEQDRIAALIYADSGSSPWVCG